MSDNDTVPPTKTRATRLSKYSAYEIENKQMTTEVAYQNLDDTDHKESPAFKGAHSSRQSHHQRHDFYSGDPGIERESSLKRNEIRQKIAKYNDISDSVDTRVFNDSIRPDNTSNFMPN